MPLKNVTNLPIAYGAKENALINGLFGQLRNLQLSEEKRQSYSSITVTHLA